MLPLAASIGPVEALLLLVIVAIVWLVPGYLSARFARDKGYSFPLFFVLGVVFGFLMLIVVLVMPRRGSVAAPDTSVSFSKRA